MGNGHKQNKAKHKHTHKEEEKMRPKDTDKQEPIFYLTNSQGMNT